jgi:hypothetical protein
MAEARKTTIDPAEYEEWLRQSGAPAAPVKPGVKPAPAKPADAKMQQEYADWISGQSNDGTWLSPDRAMGGGRVIMTKDVADAAGQLGAGFLDFPAMIPQMGHDIGQLGSLINSGVGNATEADLGEGPLAWWSKNVSGTADSRSRYTGKPLNTGLPYTLAQNLGVGQLVRGGIVSGANLLRKPIPKFVAEKSLGDAARNVGGDVLATLGGVGGANLAGGVTDNPYFVGGSSLLGSVLGGVAVPSTSRLLGEIREYNQFSDRGRNNIVGSEFNQALGGVPLGPRVETVPGMLPTAAQAFDNQGLMRLQQGDMGRSPAAAGLLGQRATENDAAIQAALERIGGTGNIADTIDYATNRLAASNQLVEADRGRLGATPDASVSSTEVRGRIDAEMEKAKAAVDAKYSAVNGKSIPVNGEQIADEVDNLSARLDPTQQSYIKNWVSDNLRGSKNMDAVISVLKQLNKQFTGSGPDGFIRGQLAETITNALDDQLTKGEKFVNDFRKDPVEGGAEALDRWREAKQEFIKFRQTWYGQPDLGKVVGLNREGMPAMTPEATMRQFFTAGPQGAGKMRQLLSVSSDPETISAIRDYAFRSMMERAREPTYARQWLNSHADALRDPALAEVKADLERVVSTWEQNKTLSKDNLSRIAGLDPAAERQAIDAVVGGRNSQTAPQNAAQVKGILQADASPEALAALSGLQKGLLNTIMDQAMSGDGELTAASLARQFKAQRGLLAQFLTPKEIRELEVAADSARINRLNKPKVAAGMSDTSALMRRANRVMEDIGQNPATAAAVGGTLGYTVGGVPGMAAGGSLGLLSHGPMKAAADALDNARIRAHLSPDRAEALIRNAQKREQWLADHPISGLMRSPSYWISAMNTAMQAAKDAKDRTQDRKEKKDGR